MTLIEVREKLQTWGMLPKRKEKLLRKRAEIVDDLDAIADIHVKALTGMPHQKGVKRTTELNALRLMKAREGSRKKLEIIDRQLRTLEITDGEMELALMVLTSKQEELVRLRYRDEYTYERLGEHFGKDARTMRRWELEAVELIRDYLEG